MAVAGEGKSAFRLTSFIPKEYLSSWIDMARKYGEIIRLRHMKRAFSAASEQRRGGAKW